MWALRKWSYQWEGTGVGRGAREVWGDSLDESTEVSTQTKHEVEIIVNSVKLV